MSIRSSEKRADAAEPVASIEAGFGDTSLAEGNNFCVASPDNPLRRNVVVSIKATLGELCLQKSKAEWAPSTEALKATFQQKKFVDLSGTCEAQGDLKSVVLHELSANAVHSTFPIALGARITGVDDATFTKNGESYSMVVLPNVASSTATKLQSDDVSLAYDFASKFPGYTAENLAEKGIHEVSQRRFVLVSGDHPIVTAISENADKLQMGEISMMPEGLVKISQGLYDSILPLVKSQVSSQIKVRDFSRMSVSLHPADHADWTAARTEIMKEAKRNKMAEMEADIAGAVNEEESLQIRNSFDREFQRIEREVDHSPREIHMHLSAAYNFLSS